MKKTSLLPLISILASTPVLAGGGKSMGYLIGKGVMFFLVVFLCSIIFWWTYLWMVQDKGKLFKK